MSATFYVLCLNILDFRHEYRSSSAVNHYTTTAWLQLLFILMLGMIHNSLVDLQS